MIDKITDFFNQYYSQFMEWYNGLEQASQYGVIVVSFLVIFTVIVFFMLSIIAKR